MGNNNLYAAAVTLNWDANSEPELAGYKIYYGTSSGDYANSVDVGKITSFNVSNLREDTTYYFAATAYDSSDQESDFSDEVSHYVPVPEPVVVDTDGDGITDDDEIEIYDTDPANPDSDEDGITDGQEISNGSDPLLSDTESEDIKTWIEAESGDLVFPMGEYSDDNASSGEYVEVPNGSGSSFDPLEDSGYTEYRFNVLKSGDYVIWGRVLAESAGDNSFFVEVDGEGYAEWHAPQSESWIWDEIPCTYYLEAGEHRLVIKQREDGTKIDKILVTNDMEYVPDGMGGL
jgi:hypothetical protein